MDKPKIKTSKDLKIETVQALSEKVRNSKSIAFVDYHGLSVNQISSLREKIKEAGGEMAIAKNTLVKKAILSNQLPDVSNQLAGPTATIFSYEDEIAPLKTIAQNIKSLGMPKFKFGFFEKKILDATTLENLANLPSRDTLQAQTVNLLVSPLRGIVNVLNANIRNLAVVLDQIAKKQVSS